MKFSWLALILIVSDASANAVVGDLLAEFERAESSVTSCGSAVLLDGGSQLFCFESGDGANLNVTLGQSISSETQLTFYLVVFGGKTHKLDWSSPDETRLLGIMRSWLNNNYSFAEIDHLRWRLESMVADPTATDPLTEDEQTALLVADLPKLLETRKADQ